MAATNFDPNDVLEGAFAIVGVSDDLSVADPTITFIAYREGEMTLTQEWENSEHQFAEQQNVVRNRLHSTVDLEFTLANHIGMSELRELGIIDSNDELQGKVATDLAIWNYQDVVPDDPTTEDPQLKIHAQDTELAFSEMSFETDAGQSTMMAYLNGIVEMIDPTSA